MFEQILAEMQSAAGNKRVYLTEHARDEMADDGLTFEDVIGCILTSEIFEQRFDEQWRENKYLFVGIV